MVNSLENRLGFKAGFKHKAHRITVNSMFATSASGAKRTDTQAHVCYEREADVCSFPDIKNNGSVEPELYALLQHKIFIEPASLMKYFFHRYESKSGFPQEAGGHDV